MILAMSHTAGVLLTVAIIIIILAMGGFIFTDDMDWFD
jgi:hypothetical protein